MIKIFQTPLVFLSKFNFNKRSLFVLIISLILIISICTFFYLKRNKCVYGNCNTGFGVLELSDGAVYAGGFLNNRFSDYGTISLPNGDKYEGGWHRGNKHGNGKYIYTDGSFYEGSFRNNIKNGKGLFTWPDNTKLEATFINGEPEGLGILTLPSNQFKSFKGIYKKGVIFEGEGIFIYDNGDRYIGNWKNGAQSGHGFRMNNAGSIIEKGYYENGFLISQE